VVNLASGIFRMVPWTFLCATGAPFKKSMALWSAAALQLLFAPLVEVLNCYWVDTPSMSLSLITRRESDPVVLPDCVMRSIGGSGHSPSF
jgi:hypothetical protein